MMTRTTLAAMAGLALMFGVNSYAKSPEVTRAERQSALQSNQAEYQRRLSRDGRANADRWLEQRAISNRPSKVKSRTRADLKNCKKVRWVNRATPGFGGSGMTMSRVAVCADK